jgi:c-di-GMP-binding flagellar brake protein YcgR
MEKRAYPRVEISRPILCLGGFSKRPQAATTVDLSMGGTRIETLDRLTFGEGLRLSIGIEPQVIKCRGTVVYVERLDDEKIRVGVRFDEISEHDRLYLREYLFHLLEQQAIVSLSPKGTSH